MLKNILPIITCGVVVSLVTIVLYIRKRRQKCNTTNQIKWHKLGQVSEMYLYPLMSAQGLDVPKCRVTTSGTIRITNDVAPILWDRMFIVYSPTPYEDAMTSKLKSGVIITSTECPRLNLLSVTTRTSFTTKVILKARGISNYEFNASYIEMLTWMSDCEISCCNKEIPPIECSDCGPGAAKWITEVLTGEKEGLRLALCKNELDMRTHVQTCYSTYEIINENENYENLAHIDKMNNMMIVMQPQNKTAEKLKRFFDRFRLHPSIVISAPKIFFEINEWKWMRIGDIIIKNKLRQPNVNKKINRLPENLKSQIFPRYLTMGLNSIVLISGNVKIGDEVFVSMHK